MFFESSWFMHFTRSLKLHWEVNLTVVAGVNYYKAVASSRVFPDIVKRKYPS